VPRYPSTLELGFFLAALGRSRVVALYEEGVELPSDIGGVLYVSFAGQWMADLATELRAADIDTDMGKV
jgi:predicted nucleotide-binding protein